MSQEREKGAGYIKFGDEDPVDRAVLVRVHHIKTAVLEVRRGLSRRQQEEIRRKSEPQEQTGDQRQGASTGRSPETPDPVLNLEQGPPGAGAFKSF